MRTNLDHLPPTQQGELERVTRHLMAEFATAIARATQPWKKNGKILKIILFGSYARSDWVDDPDRGYQSDFDLLVIVSHPDLTDIADYWYIAEDLIQRDSAIDRPVNIIVHTLNEVNQALSRGEYFWIDIARDGIVLYELPGSTLATPKPLTPADAYEMGGAYLSKQLPAVNRWLKLAQVSMEEGASDTEWTRNAAFNLHQATETAYACFLLVRTLYFPRSHNIKFLRSLAEDSEPRLVAAWPRATRLERRRFELLKRAYVEARYSANFTIGTEDLEMLTRSVRDLRNLVAGVSQQRIDELRTAAGL
ncbi:MAG: DNA-binding protein [Sphingomonas sp.]|uniref:HEPN domain-containing protein n=3 Tax=Stakelama TaxID=1124625 RepID=A0A8T4IDL8_9SPHN|nr:HEPN domain-containing protein [Stakelama sp. W311]MAW99923.1 DNA-binding protein [Sphingomonas sp.]MBR0552747.1 HEPN domain-containing protein [Stakelama marina]WNO53482.1 HEPN domain-containing protein [Stakelama sp. W311]